VRRTPIARGMSTTRRASTNRMASAHRILEERCGGNCEICGRSLQGLDFVMHHRLTRKRGGGDDVPNLLAIHQEPCHTSVHSRVARSEEFGWILPSGSIPAACSLEYMGLPAFLTDDGEVLHIDPFDEIEDPDHYRDLLIDDEIL
jgi:5-methylcytosine-specific restriction endonuclease McrA